MDTQAVEKILQWVRSTDLAEISYRRGEDAVALRLEEAGAPAAPAYPMIPVTSPEVGIFHFNMLGKPRNVEKCAEIQKDHPLGIVDTGASQHPIKAPASGRVVSILVDEGDAVQYGQPLLFIEP